MNQCRITVQKHNNGSRIQISGQKRKKDMIKIIDQLLTIFNCPIKYNLVPISTTVCYKMPFIGGKAIHRNGPHNHVDAYQLIIKSHKNNVQYISSLNGFNHYNKLL